MSGSLLPKKRIIGIHGLSGSGKTTVSEVMKEELPNSILIPGDKHALGGILKDKEGARNYFGRSFDDFDELWDYLFRLDTPEQMHDYLLWVRQYVAESIVPLIHQYLAQGYDNIIIEYMILQMIPQIWQNSITDKVGIAAPQQIISNNLIEREGTDASPLFRDIQPYFNHGGKKTVIRNDSGLSDIVKKAIEYCKQVCSKSPAEIYKTFDKGF